MSNDDDQRKHKCLTLNCVDSCHWMMGGEGLVCALKEGYAVSASGRGYSVQCEEHQHTVVTAHLPFLDMVDIILIMALPEILMYVIMNGTGVREHKLRLKSGVALCLGIGNTRLGTYLDIGDNLCK
ncbi:hypothetical protein V8E55_008941 [Tylopilus felleus]